MKFLVVRLSIATLCLLYSMAWLAPFLVPYSAKQQFRDRFLSPPDEIHFRDSAGRWQFRPFIYARARVGPEPTYRQTGEMLPIHFFVKGKAYSWMGLRWERRLFGLKDANRPLFLLGSDSLGRDLLSRILFGARFSLTIGLVGILSTAALGVLLGGLAGYFSGWTDRLLMRGADLFLSLPALFVILGIRAVFPGQMTLSGLYWLIILIFTLVGWASIARVIRGQVLSLKERDYVLAARVSGAGNWWILTRHVLPFTSNFLIVQISILVPAFILGEITLSFLGVGVQEPDASWGTLLVAATSVRTLTTHQWLLYPALFIFVTVLAFALIGDELKALDRRRQMLV